MTEHELRTEGPVRYPGGKDGWFRTYCICNPDRLWWGATEAQSRKPGREHKRAKENVVEIEAAVEAVPAAEWRARVLQWLTGPYAYTERPDLAERLTEGEFVALTYRELSDIVDTVRHNSKQR